MLPHQKQALVKMITGRFLDKISREANVLTNLMAGVALACDRPPCCTVLESHCPPSTGSHTFSPRWFSANQDDAAGSAGEDDGAFPG